MEVNPTVAMSFHLEWLREMEVLEERAATMMEAVQICQEDLGEVAVHLVLAVLQVVAVAADIQVAVLDTDVVPLEEEEEGHLLHQALISSQLKLVGILVMEA